MADAGRLAGSIAAAVAASAEALVCAGLEPGDARRDAALLARTVLGSTAAEWLTRQQDAAPAGFDTRLGELTARRARHEPVAYLTGRREFYGRPFTVTRDVLVPRPETELVVDEALACLASMRASGVADPITIVDVGTGSGCIAVTLALEGGDVQVIATDVSAAALDIARENARRLGATDRITFRHAPLVADLERAADLVVSNPPYVAESDRASLPPDVRDWEPATALFGGIDGLDVIRALLPAAARALRPGGWLVMEIGAGQDAAVQRLLGAAWRSTTRDLAGVPRVVRGTGLFSTGFNV